MTYIIGSFNMCKFNRTSTNEVKKNLQRIAAIIKSEKFDILALQEILSVPAFKDLLQVMGEEKWGGICAPATSHFTHGNEYYGYLWRKDRFTLLGSPRIYGWYKVKDSLCKNGLLRPPYVARFSPNGLLGGGFFEFRIINTHIMFSKPEHALDELGDVKLRKEELRLLSERIYKSVADKRYGDNMPAYTFLIGDYNLCLYGEGPKIEFEYDIGDDRLIVHDQTDKTSLKRPVSMSNSTDEEQSEQEIMDEDDFGGYYSRNYDHISYEKAMKGKLSISASRVEALGDYYQNDLEKYRHDISDHVPIKVSIDLRPQLLVRARRED